MITPVQEPPCPPAASATPSPACLCSPSIGFGLGGCAAADRLAEVGQAPALSSIEDPTAQPGYKPVRMPMPDPQPVAFASNSLWRQGSRAFFKDQRAQQIGDLVTVRVKVTDRAQHRQSTKRSRKSGGRPRRPEPVRARSRRHQVPAGRHASSTRSSTPIRIRRATGSGSVRRSEQLVTNVAAVVTQVLPNGNLVIEGKQEIRVNFEVRELIVAGVVRPEDIEADNTIDSTKIAAGAHRLWRARPDHRRAAAALRPAGHGHPAAVLNAARKRRSPKRRRAPL